MIATYERNPKHFWISVGISCVVSWGLTLLGVHGMNTYGVFIFLAIPFLQGYGVNRLYVAKAAGRNRVVGPESCKPDPVLSRGDLQ